MEKKDFLIGGAAFLAAFIIGFAGTFLGRKLMQPKDDVAVEGGGSSTEQVESNPVTPEPGNSQKIEVEDKHPGGSTAEADPAGEEEGGEVEPSQEVETTTEKPTQETGTQKPAEPVELTASQPAKTKDGYNVVLTAKNVPAGTKIHYELRDKQTCVAKSPKGDFVKVPGCATGSYTGCVVDDATSKVLCSIKVDGFKLEKEESKDDTKPQVPHMSAAEFQKLLLSNDSRVLGGRHPQVAKRVSIRVEGLKSGERKPDDILAVREKISFGVWMSARVKSVSYDDTGRINGATITPVYPAEEGGDNMGE